MSNTIPTPSVRDQEINEAIVRRVRTFVHYGMDDQSILAELMPETEQSFSVTERWLRWVLKMVREEKFLDD